MSFPCDVRHVQFAEQVVIYEYETYCPCMQEILANWQECKRIHLQNIYILNHGSLNNFDFDQECKREDASDEADDSDSEVLPDDGDTDAYEASDEEETYDSSDE